MAIGIFAWNLALPNIRVSALRRANNNAQAPASRRNVCNTTQNNTKSSDVAADEIVLFKLTTVKERPRRSRGLYSEFRFMVFDIHCRCDHFNLFFRINMCPNGKYLVAFI